MCIYHLSYVDVHLYEGHFLRNYSGRPYETKALKDLCNHCNKMQDILNCAEINI